MVNWLAYQPALAVVLGLGLALMACALTWRAALSAKRKRLNRRRHSPADFADEAPTRAAERGVRPDVDPIRLNKGLSLAMDWGKDWLMPIQERLRAWDSSITPEQADAINEICQRAMRFGWELVRDQRELSLSDFESKDEFDRRMLEEYPWVDKQNLGRLYSQALYIAMK
jgi:hypothetical protein